MSLHSFPLPLTSPFTYTSNVYAILLFPYYFPYFLTFPFTYTFNVFVFCNSCPYFSLSLYLYVQRVHLFPLDLHVLRSSDSAAVLRTLLLLRADQLESGPRNHRSASRNGCNQQFFCHCLIRIRFTCTLSIKKSYHY